MAAHVVLCNEVRRALPSDVALAVCPTEYQGRGTEPSLAELGAGLDPRIDLFWTGRAICSATLDLDDARVFERTAGRRPLYWDNYPVNDVAMGYELHIGPYRGRDPELWRASRGVVANAMELFEASRIPLATIADYLRDPAGYEPEASWQQAMLDVVGVADLDAFAVFADRRCGKRVLWRVRVGVELEGQAGQAGGLEHVRPNGVALCHRGDSVRIAARSDSPFTVPVT